MWHFTNTLCLSDSIPTLRFLSSSFPTLLNGVLERNAQHSPQGPPGLFRNPLKRSHSPAPQQIRQARNDSTHVACWDALSAALVEMRGLRSSSLSSHQRAAQVYTEVNLVSIACYDLSAFRMVCFSLVPFAQDGFIKYGRSLN